MRAPRRAPRASAPYRSRNAGSRGPRHRARGSPSRAAATRAPALATPRSDRRSDDSFPSGTAPGQEIALPEVEEDALVRLRRLAPELARVEGDAVEGLGRLAEPVGIRVGKDVNAVDPGDHAALAARIAGPPDPKSGGEGRAV